MKSGNTQTLLMVVIVLLVGMIAVAVVKDYQQSPADKMADSMSEVVEEIGDEIDDNTDAQ